MRLLEGAGVAEGRRWPRPVAAPTAVTRAELEVLQRFASEAAWVLEVGTWYGHSAIGMAMAGAEVVTVDPHRDGPADERDTWPAFLGYLARYQEAIADAGGHVWPFREPIERWGEGVVSRGLRFGMAFIDGDHDYSACLRDGWIAARFLERPGFLAFHDVVRPNWPGVCQAVKELTEQLQLQLLRREGCLEVYRLG